jgi:hypothetical protein
MRKVMLSAVVFVVVLTLHSCSGIKVVSDVDPTVNWSDYKTFEYYGWAKESEKLITSFDKDRIENAFGAEFSKRGLEYVEKGGDMIVVLFIVVEQKTETTARTTSMGGYYGGYYGYGPGYGWGPGWGEGMSSTTIDEYDYQVGTLVVDVFDAKEERLIWEGIGTKTVDENPQTRDKNIPKSVMKIMTKFPVQPIAP